MQHEGNREIQEFLESKKHKRNMNAFFREDVGIWKVPHPEVDNSFEMLRSKLYVKYPKYKCISRLCKKRRRIGSEWAKNRHHPTKSK